MCRIAPLQLQLLLLDLISQVNRKLMTLKDFFFLIQLHGLMRVAFLYDFLEVISAHEEVASANLIQFLFLALIAEADLFKECLRLELFSDCYEKVMS